MRKNLHITIISVILAASVLFLASCGVDLGIGTAPSDTQKDPSDMQPGPGGIGLKDGAYNGLFDKTAEIRITIDDAGMATIRDHADAEMYCECSVKANGGQTVGAAIKTRGNISYVTSVGNGRYSFKLKFDKYTKDQTLDGLDVLYLNNISYDPSYIREYLAYSLLSTDAKFAAPLATFAKLYLNDEYYGLYLAVEGVDDSFLKRACGENEGGLYKADKGSSFLSDDTSSFTLENGDDENLVNVRKLYEALGSGEFEDMLDVGSVLRYAAFMCVVCGTESYLGPKAENYYLYCQNDGTMSIIPWDLKMTFGVNSEYRKTSYSIDGDLIEKPVSEPYFGVTAEDRPLVSKLLEKTEYKTEYLSYVKQYNDELAKMLPKLASLKAEIDEAVSADEKRFYDDETYQAEYTDGDTLYGFIKARCEFIGSSLG